MALKKKKDVLNSPDDSSTGGYVVKRSFVYSFALKTLGKLYLPFSKLN